MPILDDIEGLTLDEIEDVEKLTLQWLIQATLDFGFQSAEIFHYSPDSVKDVAEDVTREIVDRLPGYNLTQRIFGTVDYKKARYIILPQKIIRQALFLDSKAEKSNTTATLQISQTSLEVRQIRNGEVITEPGRLPSVYIHDGEQYLSSTLFLHYCYGDVEGTHELKEIIGCCVPNGLLQNRYNPTPDISFWSVGRNAPSRGEDFRTRVNFSKLKAMRNWRVQKISVDSTQKRLCHTWDD